MARGIRPSWGSIKNLLPGTEPLAARLLRANTHRKPQGDFARVNIVSSNLCDDVLARLSSSLQPYTHCDIIEVNPGPGLWSSKVHNLLKPRNHLLLEPETSLYLPFLKPLLDRRDSTYRHVPYSGLEWSSYHRLFEEGHLPEQQRLAKGDPRKDLPNESLLFLANLAYHPAKRSAGFSSLAHLMLHQFLSAVRTQSIFQAYGMVRMLIWFEDNEKKNVLPRNVAERHKFSVEAESSCAAIYEVAGAEGAAGKTRRETKLDVQSTLNVTRKMHENSVETPEKRKGQAQSEAEGTIAQASIGASTLAQTDLIQSSTSMRDETRAWHEELVELERGYKEGLFARYVGVTPSAELNRSYPQRETKSSKEENRDNTPEYTKLVYLRHALASQHRKKEKMDKVLDQAEELDALDQILVDDTSISLQERRKIEAEVAKKSKRYHEDLGMLGEKTRDKTALYMDDRHAFMQQPPLLLWDRRMVEPLITHPQDALPQKNVALLDFHPKPLGSALRRSSESQLIFEFMVSSLFCTPKQTIERGLEMLAPGAAAALIPQVPALQDVKKGGRRRLERLRVRMLTLEMLEGLVAAWEKWPFRPSKVEMLVKMGTVSDDDEASRLGPTAT